MSTFANILDRAGITTPDQALADIDVPVLTGPQRQGDVLIVPRAPIGAAELANMTRVPAAGLPVVRGEATGNTHLLMPEHDTTIWWAPATPTRDADVTLGVLHVPDNATAWLIHTDEHGVNGIGIGTYTLRGKREQAEEIRRVQD
jgi:hypothetical protein